MKSAKRGKATLLVELVHVSVRGMWIYFEPLKREMFLSFREFPWFADATIHALANIEVEHGRLLRWPDLDVDLDVDRIEHPERYPLVARSKATKRIRAARAPRVSGAR